MVELICAAAAVVSFEKCIDVLNVFKVNCKGNSVKFYEVSLEFLLLNLDIFVTWIWFSVAERRKSG